MSIVIGHATAKGVDHRFAFFQEIIASLTILGDLPRERCHGLAATRAGESGIIWHGFEHEPRARRLNPTDCNSWSCIEAFVGIIAKSCKASRGEVVREAR